MTFGQFQYVGTLHNFFWSSCGGPFFVGAPVRPNMPKSASVMYRNYPENLGGLGKIWGACAPLAPT